MLQSVLYAHDLNIDLPQLFQFDDTYLNAWSLQWAMLQRDIHVFSMSGISDIADKHPNGGDIKKLARLETVCKYYSLISKLQIDETIQSLEGNRVHEHWTWMSCKCPYCGEHISKSRSWKTISQVTSSIWTHLGTCDRVTNCQGLGPGLEPDVIEPFDAYPLLIEARMSKEGLLTFESLLEEALVRCMESVMNCRVKWFESLLKDWGPDCEHAQKGCEIWIHELGEKGPWVSTFNIPLLESIASGHFFDRTFAPVTEDIEKVRHDNKRCLQLLEAWKSKFPPNYKNPNLKIFKKGEGLTQEFLSQPTKAILSPGRFERHPDLHPTGYRPTVQNDIRLILPVKGVLPMGSAKGIIGYGVIHPNLINASVLQTYGLSGVQGHFDAMSLAPNFDLLLTQQEASMIASRIAEWSVEEIDMGDQGRLLVQTPHDPTKENMKHHRNFINPTRRSVAQNMTMVQIRNITTMQDELTWLLPLMSATLQNQGTNTRALCYHLLQCKEDKTKEPKLTEATIQQNIETVINNSRLQLESEEDLKAVKDGTQSLKTVLDSKTSIEKDIFLWNYAGVLLQTGEWRRFHSAEEFFIIIASFWGMKAPKVVPTCTAWSIFQDEGIQVQFDRYRQHAYYLDSIRRSTSPSRRVHRSETPAPRTPIQTPKPPPTLEDLVEISDPTWNPDLHRGVDYLWAIMQDSERQAFLTGITQPQESTSMSAMVPPTSEPTSPPTEPTQPQPNQEETGQPEETSAMEGTHEESGEFPVPTSDQPTLEEIKKESDSVKQENDQSDSEEAAADQASQVATAGSVLGDVGQVVDLQLPQVRRNPMARYSNGNMSLDTFVDIFNILCATASRYVDSEGTFVRKLTMSDYPLYIRESLGGYDPIIVFVDSEIEEAIRASVGDLSSIMRRYPLHPGVDWITFQYHMSLLQQEAQTGWNAPGFRRGGRLPMSVGNICQNLIAHDAFVSCHSTPIKDWRRVRHMNTLGKDPATRGNYVHDAIAALLDYNQLAAQANPQLEEMVMDDMMMIDHDDWAAHVDTLSDAIRTGTGIIAIPESQLQERERLANEAADDLVQSIDEENEERARKSQKKKEKKDRKSHSTSKPPAPTVVLTDYSPPPEPSTEEEGESVTRKLDFDQASRAVSVREPETPEELHQQPNRPSSPRETSPPLDLDGLGYDTGPKPVEVDAPERVEDQNQPTEGDNQAEQDTEQPPPEGDQPAENGEQDTGEGQDNSGQPPAPDPPEPPEDPDDPDPLPEEEEDEDDEEEQQEGEEGGEEGEEGVQGEGEEEEKEEEDPPLQEVESETTKKARKLRKRKEKVDMAALTRLPYALAEMGPSYRGTEIEAKGNPRASSQWRPRKGAPTRAKDNAPINHGGNRSFENIRDHQISSIFTLQKHLADCHKGPREKKASPDPLRSSTGEFSPCQTKVQLIQTEEGNWHYECAEMPGLVPMSYGMKTFHIIEQVPFGTPPTGPHRNLVRQIIEELDIQVKSKKVQNKHTPYINELPPEVNPESIRAARVLLHDISNHQYVGVVDRGLEYYPSTLTIGNNQPVSDVDATGDWIHLASLAEMIKGIKQRNINSLPFYLRGLIRMVPLKHMHQILLYAALTDLKTISK